MNKKPNVIFILADDLGYGDISGYNENSKIETPYIDSMIKDGIRFCDAHAPAAVCTPSRYGILTGRYCFRGSVKTGVLWPYDGAIIEKDRNTVADIFKQSGYKTGAVGKWHLGWDWRTKDGHFVHEFLKQDVMDIEGREKFEENIDFTHFPTGGPCDHGFDFFYGMDCPNFPPFTFFDNGRFDPPLTSYYDPYISSGLEFPGGYRGVATENWQSEDIAEKMVEAATSYIENNKDNPFFLYFSLTGPHCPMAPTEPFIGSSGVGVYGDFVKMMDWSVGEVLRTLRENELEENTIVIFTSDNGPELFCFDRIQQYNHYSMGNMRGIKSDALEGGHRVPFIVRWPDKIKPNTVCNDTISAVDFFASMAQLLEHDIAENEAEDSKSFLHLINNDYTEVGEREVLIYHSEQGKFAIRHGDWVYIDSDRAEDKEEPEWLKVERNYESDNLFGKLYNLKTDGMQRRNLALEFPNKLSELKAMCAKYLNQNTTVKR